MNSEKRDISFWHGQFMHAISLLLLLVLAWLCWQIIGTPVPTLFWLAITVPVAHQIFVWLAWRSELKYSLVSARLGFKFFLLIFFALFLARFVSLGYLAWADRGSVGLGINISVLLAILLLIPGLYAMYSVRTYFGLARAAGADHFYETYRSMPLVKEGIFRYTSNGMYLYAFLLFWAIAVGFGSSSALIVALFSHIYIWVHYYCTERPDMEYIYG